MKVGVIGCGFIGHKHVRSLLQTTGIEISALCDSSKEAAERLDGMIRKEAPQHSERMLFQDYNALLQKDEVECVIIAVNSGLHGQIAKEALILGKHVIVEKPMTLSLQEARELIRLSDAFGGKVAVCHQKRFLPHLQQLKRYVEEGRLGRLLFASTQLFYNRDDQYYAQAPWRGTWEMDGGVMLNQGIHNMDLTLWLVGEPSSVTGVVRRNERQIEAEDTAASMLYTKSGALVQLQATVCAKREAAWESIELVGTKGAVKLSGKWMERVEKWQLDGIEPIHYEDVDPYQKLYENFMQAIKTDKQPYVNGEEAIRVLDWIMGIYHSARNGHPIYYPIPDLSTSEMRGNEPYGLEE